MASFLDLCCWRRQNALNLWHQAQKSWSTSSATKFISSTWKLFFFWRHCVSFINRFMIGECDAVSTKSLFFLWDEWRLKLWSRKIFFKKKCERIKLQFSGTPSMRGPHPNPYMLNHNHSDTWSIWSETKCSYPTILRHPTKISVFNGSFSLSFSCNQVAGARHDWCQNGLLDKTNNYDWC